MSIRWLKFKMWFKGLFKKKNDKKQNPYIYH